MTEKQLDSEHQFHNGVCPTCGLKETSKGMVKIALEAQKKLTEAEKQ